MHSERRGTLYGLAAYGIWGLFPLYFPLLEPATPLEVLFLRIVLSFVVVAIALTVTHRWAVLLAARRHLALAAVGGVLIAVNWGVYLWAVANDRVVEAALGYFINPLVTVALGVGVLGERLRRAQLVALAIALVAVGVLTLAYGRAPVVALVLASSFATYGLVKKLLPLDALSSLAIETAVLTPVAVVGLVGVAVAGNLVIGPEHPDTTVMLATVGAVTVVPLVLFGAAARRVPLSLLGLLQYVTPVGQFLCGVLVFHEDVTGARWVGFVLVWTALAVLTVDALRAARPVVTTPEPETAAFWQEDGPADPPPRDGTPARSERS